MSDTIQTVLSKANRQVDRVIRDAAMMVQDIRAARTVSKVMLISKLELLEQHARELERTLEILTRDTRHPVIGD